MNLLFSFLGKTRSAKGYADSVYRFDDGREIHTSFFGMGLARQTPPDRFVVLGTPSSMWDVLLDQQTEDFDRQPGCLALIEAVQAGTVNEELLRELQPLIEARVGCPVTLAVIPLGRDEAEQIGILRRMADLVHQGDEVTLDVTHGLRHLPMLGLAASYYLGHVRRARVQEILYGAWEMAGAGQPAPVVRLSGLLRVMDWVQTLSAYDKDGDYGPFAELLRQEGLPEHSARQLRQAAYQERINDIAPAQAALQPLREVFNTLDSPLAQLFVPALNERLNWTELPHRDEWELHLGDDYFRRGDYLRAAIHYLEGRISREVRGNPQAGERRPREQAEKGLHTRHAEWPQLDSIRNCMAHGVRRQGEKAEPYLQNEATLRHAFKRIREKLFGAASGTTA